MPLQKRPGSFSGKARESVSTKAPWPGLAPGVTPRGMPGLVWEWRVSFPCLQGGEAQDVLRRAKEARPSGTASSLALANRARRVRDGFVASTYGKFLLVFLNRKLHELREPLRSGALEKLSQEELQEIAGLIRQLIAGLNRLSDDAELKSHKGLESALQVIAGNIEGFQSILESIYLALDPEFKVAISSAIGQLKLGVEERAALLR
jgi:hypothetical protein